MPDLRASTLALAVLAVAALTGSDAPPAPLALPFAPTPEVCFHGIGPPPCEYPVVSKIGGILRFAPLEFGGSGSSSSIGRQLDSEVPGTIHQPSIPGDYEVFAWDSHGQLVDGVILEVIRYGPESDFLEVFVLVDTLLSGTAGVSRVEFRLDGRTLGTWTTGPSAPRVMNVTATATYEGIQVAWEASDPDGDPLRFGVSVVASDEEVSGTKVGVCGSSTTIPRSHLRGSGPYRVRVDASDGINLAWAVSEQEVVILKPSPES